MISKLSSFLCPSIVAEDFAAIGKESGVLGATFNARRVLPRRVAAYRETFLILLAKIPLRTSAIQVARPSESTANTQPQLHPALLRLSATNEPPMPVYEVRPRKDKRGVDLISDVLPFGRLWYDTPDHAIGYANPQRPFAGCCDSRLR